MSSSRPLISFVLIITAACLLADAATMVPCTADDYIVASTSTACNAADEKRTITYKTTGDCIGPREVTVPASCRCSLEEYALELEEGGCRADTNEQTIKGWDHSRRCIGDDSVVRALNDALLGNTTVPCECSADDIGSMYTPTTCSDASGRRELVFYWKRPCTRRAGGVSLPLPSSVGCADECDDGQFLAPPAASCQDCPSGTYSIAGQIHSAPWLSWPSNFHTVCSSGTCTPWTLRNDTIQSGDLHHVDNTYSQLKLWVDVRTVPAILRVTYKVSSELYGDYFVISAQGRTVFSRSGVMPEYEVAEVDLHDDAAHCKWSLHVPGVADAADRALLNNTCLTRNSFHPYKDTTHFSKKAAPITFQRAAVAQNGGCLASDYSSTAYAPDTIVVIARGGCDFVTKVLSAQKAGAAAVLVYDNIPHDPLHIHMAGDATDINIPSGLISDEAGLALVKHILATPNPTLVLQRDAVELGRIEVLFTYVKDFSISKGEDKVYIKDITVTGTEFAAKKCTACPPGHTSGATSDKCTLCPANTYGPGYGTAAPCLPCPRHHVSEPGSVLCQPTSECVIDDYAPVFSPCRLPGSTPQRTLSYERVRPALCDYNHSKFVPPAPVDDMPCADCSTGSVREGASCKTCPRGTAAIGGQCVPCPDGSVAVPVLSYDGFDELGGALPKDWSATCGDGCVGRGWRFGLMSSANTTLKLSSLIAGGGALVGQNMSTVLGVPISLIVDGSVTFSYSIQGWSPQSLRRAPIAVSVSVISGDDIAATRELYSVDNDHGATATNQLVTVSLPLSAGSYTLQWSYATLAPDTPARFVLHMLEIAGDERGGASSCVACPAGFECSDAIPRACPRGTYSASVNSTSCAPCTSLHPALYVSTHNASTTCTMCPLATVPNKDHSMCVFNPIVRVTNGTIDLTPVLSLSPLRAPLRRNDVDTGAATGHRTVVVTMPSSSNATSPPEVRLEFPDKTTTLLIGTLTGTEVRGEGYDAYRSLEMRFRNDDELCTIGAGSQTVPLRSTATITFVCDPSASSASASANSKVTSFDGCTLNMVVPTPDICPVCDKDIHMRSSATMCVDGKYHKVWQWASDDAQPRCAGGAALPATTLESCPISLRLAQHSHTVVVVVVLLGIGVVSLVAGVYYLHQSKQKIYAQYQTLSQQTAPHEMGAAATTNVSIHDDDDDDDDHVVHNRECAYEE